MPLTVRSLKGNTKITWTNQSQTTEASWTIKKEMSEKEAWEILTKATVFIGKQLGAMPEETPSPTSLTAKTASATGATTAGTSPTPSPSPTSALILGSGSFSDKPSDGGPPRGSMDTKFWESMPTDSVPARLAGGEAGWEMDPGEGWQ